MAAESVPVIGFFIPGVLILPALGVMTGAEAHESPSRAKKTPYQKG